MSRVTEYEVAEVEVDAPQTSEAVASLVEVMSVVARVGRSAVAQAVASPAASVAVGEKGAAEASAAPVTALPQEVHVQLKTLAAEVPTVARADVPRLVALVQHATAAAPAEQAVTVERLTDAVRASHGQVTATQLCTAVTATLRDLGFDHVVVRPDQRGVRAADSASSRAMRVDMSVTPSGRLYLAAESDGCPGDTCNDLFQKFEAGLRARGVRANTTFQRPKQRQRFARLGNTNRQS